MIALLALAAPASAGKAVSYVGKTSSGHKVTFKIKDRRMHDLTAGIRMACVPIQGGGSPLGGSEVFGFRGWVPLKRHNRYSFMEKPAFHYNEVTMNHDLWLTRRGKGTITGRIRLQYSFLIPKYPIGTFAIYSCLGGATFKATARRKQPSNATTRRGRDRPRRSRCRHAGRQRRSRAKAGVSSGARYRGG